MLKYAQMSNSAGYSDSPKGFPAGGESYSAQLFGDVQMYAEYRLADATEKHSNDFTGSVWATYATDVDTRDKLATFNLGEGQNIGDGTKELWQISVPFKKNEDEALVPDTVEPIELTEAELVLGLKDPSPSYIVVRNLRQENAEAIVLTPQNCDIVGDGQNGLLANSLLDKLADISNFFVHPTRVLNLGI
jgi:hypothetical protein